MLKLVGFMEQHKEAMEALTTIIQKYKKLAAEEEQELTVLRQNTCQSK